MPSPSRSRVQTFVLKHLKSGYFFSNQKTNGLAVDFRVCPLMKKKGGTYASKTCSGCYSATILTVYPVVAKKIENLPLQTPETLALFEQDCKALHKAFPEIEKLRFYALSDYGKGDLPYILTASKYFTIDIISKSLCMPHNEEGLKALLNIPNVWLSLSFSKHFFKFFDRVRELIKDAYNAQLNYLMNYRQENPLDEKFTDVSVFHFRNVNKRQAMDWHKGLSADRVCAIFNESGHTVRAHGSCDACNNCHVALKDLRNNVSAPLPKQYALMEI